MTEYVVHREISDVHFSDQQVEEFKKSIKKNLIDEDRNITDQRVERKLKEKMKEVAKDNTQYDQGDNRLHRDISHSEPEEKS